MKPPYKIDLWRSPNFSMLRECWSRRARL